MAGGGASAAFYNETYIAIDPAAAGNPSFRVSEALHVRRMAPVMKTWFLSVKEVAPSPRKVIRTKK
jgi:hypothetical protein